MNKILVFILSIVLIMCSLTSCHITGVYKLNISEKHYMQICAYFSVPISLPNDIKDTVDLNCNLKERDNQGRMMFTLDTYNSATLQKEQYMVICQKTDLNYIYYYEDLSYLTNGYSESDIETLKVNNDWDMPLDETKMSRREISYSIDGIINYHPYIHMPDVFKICKTRLDVTDDDISYFDYIESDGISHSTYNLITNKDGEKSVYYVICDTNMTIAFLKLEGNEFVPAEYAEFKKNNGWIYGW